MSATSRGVVLFIDQSWDDQPANPGEPVTLFILPAEDGGLFLKFVAPYHGDPRPPGPPGPTEGLWEHEVVEFFVSGEGDPVPYTEVEIGPHGHSLTLTFRGVRQSTERLIPLPVTVSRDDLCWSADVRLPPALLPPKPWRFLACAVHGPPEARRYLCAPSLPGPKPDFHQPERWAPLVFPS